MTGDRPIIVGADGSVFGEAAVRWAACDAVLRDAELVIVHAASPVMGTWLAIPAPADVLEWQHRLGRDILEHSVNLAREAAGAQLRVRTREMSCPTAAALIELSEHAQLTVVGSRGRGKVARRLLGSVSMGLVHHSRCPVAVIRPSATSDDFPASATAPVLVGVDFSPDSEQATELAFEEASRREVTLVALHAWWSPGTFEFAGPEWGSVEREVEQSFAARFALWQDRYPGVEVQRVVVRDAPAHEIAVRSEEAQLVVVGSRGYGAVASTLLGSVSTAVVQAVQAPVIVARS
ncbi:universal stress protein [Mycobacterium sp. IDR2000157661]|uniref:universal stress protein n=1 Tax=Mycobacterium sp. IDR2000157661 TaxID=2867005 RepID=UPI001EE9F934|nr:universal stress protein [Mycobacterium sp. IDR2000157661]ULE33419.1 universal stress protein [Mycobacterium sp. IDR2000157661]